MSEDEASSRDSDGELRPEDSLVHGRARRSTAGNRLSILLQAYGDEDVQNDLLKDEEEDQVDYEASDDGGDVDLESSDESDDDGPPKEGEEEKLEGEQELQKQERVEAKKRKRKAQELLKIPQPKKKRVTLADDVSTTTATDTPTAPRQRKKSERTSWLPTAEDAPTRQSLRNATVLNKEQTEVKLRESQKRSEKAHEMLRIAAEKRAANAGPVLTQADRIARALKTEKENSKSLNRWVQVEEERRTAQRKRLEALRNRQIEGPVIRYWSASVIWEGDKIKVRRVHKPKVEVVEEPAGQKPPTKEQKPELQDQASSVPSAASPRASIDAASAGERLEGHAGAPAETASAAGKAEEQPINPLPPAASASDMPASGAELDKDNKVAEPDQDPDRMQIDDPVQKPDLESATKTTNTTETNEPKPLDQPADSLPNATPKPAEEPTPHASNFLDGIHYWASQAPVESDGKNNPTSSNDQAPSTPAVQAPTIAKQQDDAQHATASEIDPVPSETHVPHQPAATPQQNQAAAAPVSLQRSPSPSLVSATDAEPLKAGVPNVTLPPNTFPSAPPYVFAGYAHTFPPLAASSTMPPGASDQPGGTPLPAGPPPAPAVPLLREQALRTLLTLQAFPQLDNVPIAPPPTSRSKAPPAATAIISSILLPDAHPTLSPAEHKYLTARSLKKKGDHLLPDRPAKASCCITAKEAKFRDPRTGLGYRDLAAFKSLQRVLAGGCAWSVNEGCWVGIVGDGRMGRVAQGVPEGFWSGELPPKKNKDVVKLEEGAKGMAEGQAPATAPTGVPAVASGSTLPPRAQTQLPQPPRPVPVQAQTSTHAMSHAHPPAQPFPQAPSQTQVQPPPVQPQTYPAQTHFQSQTQPQTQPQTQTQTPAPAPAPTPVQHQTTS